MQHTPVLYQEIIHALQPTSQGRYVDGTVGTGGHAYGLLSASSPNGRLLGLDLDPESLQVARKRLEEFGDRVVLICSSYTELRSHLNNLEWDTVDGILLDLGLSSLHLDRPDRGFSFRHAGPLDMRYDPSQQVTAADLVNGLPREELANLIYRYGEERNSRKIADAIVANRPLETTQELASLIARVIGTKSGSIHPATRTFQALRIAVNNELERLKTVLPIALESLNSGGRLAVIAFHSLEDRIVKRFFRRESQDCICPPQLPVCACDHEAQLKEISRRPIRPSEREREENPRSRSAKLRVAEKL
ncbi:MAG: 16S rRNA (cytosine(1402)-N(4))-methyltransferase RsmH [Anaerolineales bacterium]